MRKLDPPVIQDNLLLSFLQHSRKENAKAIVHRIADIAERYQAYDICNGDPWGIAEDVSYAPLKEDLNGIYKAPPSVLNFIATLRSQLDGVCPVCGRDALGTLDHYLPKANYAEFSFYSKIWCQLVIGATTREATRSKARMQESALCIHILTTLQITRSCPYDLNLIGMRHC